VVPPPEPSPGVVSLDSSESEVASVGVSVKITSGSERQFTQSAEATITEKTEADLVDKGQLSFMVKDLLRD
jgi:hypothetical protein